MTDSGLLSDPARIVAAAVGTGVCALAILGIAWLKENHDQPKHLVRQAVAVFVPALLLRAGMSLVQDGGTFDIFNAYRGLGDQLRSGGDIFKPPYLGLASYPPVIYWWWAAAAAIVPSGHPHLFAAVVRAPFWICDAAIAPVLLCLTKARFRIRAAWSYAINPIAIIAPTLHGQFDALPVMALLLGVAWFARHPRATAWAIGVGTAIKTWPVYFTPVLLGSLRNVSRVGFIIRVAALPIAAFAIYAVIHPQNVLRGVFNVLIYTPHRQGFGTSRFFPDSWGDAVVPVTNVLLLMLVIRIAYLCYRRARVNVADVVALSILLVLGLSASVSDQYLMWPFALLLFNGRLRMAALLALLITPAAVTIDLNSAAGNPIHVPTWLLLPASLALWTAAAILWKQTFSPTGQPQSEQLIAS